MPLFGLPNVEKMRTKGDVQGLIKALGSSNDLKRVRAAAALGLVGDKRAVEPLVAALRDQVAGVRMASARALGQIGDARATEPLIAVLADPDPDVGRLAAEALARAGSARAVEALVEALGNDKVRKKAAEALAQIGRPAVEQLLEALQSNSMRTLRDPAAILRQMEVPGVAAEVLGQIGDPSAVEPLITALGGGDVRAQRAAAEALGRIGDARAVEPLVSALKDKTGFVRVAAARALLALFQSGKLDRAARALILESRPTMAVEHTDRSRHVDAKDSICWYERNEYSHTDSGIGVDLPL